MGAQRSHLHQRRKSQKPRCARWHARANLASQLQLDSLDLDVVVVVDSALGLVGVVLVVVVGVVLRPLRAPRRDCRVQTRGS